MSDVRIVTLLQQQVNVSNITLESQLKMYALNENQVSLSEQILQAQLRNNELHEERNAMLMLSLIPLLSIADPTDLSATKMTREKIKQQTVTMSALSKDEKEFLDQMRQKYFLTPKPNALSQSYLGCNE